MATHASGFSPRYTTFSGSSSRFSEPATPKFDIQAFIEWAMNCGTDVFRIFQDIIERLEAACVEATFRPAYRLPSPYMTLSLTEVHEAIAKKSYIESLGSILGSDVASRLTDLANTEAGWDGGDAEAMSLDSLSAMENFFKKAGSFSDDIGFFLGYDGEILINWKDPTGALIDMSFFEGSAEISSDFEDRRFSIQDPDLYNHFANTNSIHT